MGLDWSCYGDRTSSSSSSSSDSTGTANSTDFTFARPPYLMFPRGASALTTTTSPPSSSQHSQSTNGLHRLPPRSPWFIQREDVLRRLEDCLVGRDASGSIATQGGIGDAKTVIGDGGASTLSVGGSNGKIVACVGPSGVGKSAAVLEMCWRNVQAFAFVHWMRADDPLYMQLQLARLAKAVVGAEMEKLQVSCFRFRGRVGGEGGRCHVRLDDSY